MVMIALMLGAILGTFAFEMTGNIHDIRIIATSVVQSGVLISSSRTREEWPRLTCIQSQLLHPVAYLFIR
jgi:hypothetical protein